MKNLFELNDKLVQAIEKYSKTTEEMFKYQQKLISKQYDTVIEVVKTLNSIKIDDSFTPKANTTKPAEKKADVEVKTTPVVKAEVKKETIKPTEVKTTIAPVKTEVKPVAKKEEVKAVVKTATPVKQVVETKPAVKTEVKKAAEPVKAEVKTAPAKKTTPAAKKSSSQDRLEALKQATQHAVKKNKMN
jgi:hypothetical protein